MNTVVDNAPTVEVPARAQTRLMREVFAGIYEDGYLDGLRVAAAMYAAASTSAATVLEKHVTFSTALNAAITEAGRRAGK